MNILMVGDIFGKTGREALSRWLPQVRRAYDVDMVIANGENVTHGKGLFKRHYDELLFEGVSLVTMGNHTYAKKEIFDYIDEADRLIVPANKPRALPGVGSRAIEIKGRKVRVTNLLGLTFMSGTPQNPFETIDDILKDDDSDIHIVDFHAEATSEKAAMGYYLDGRVSAVLGTHTHVPTNDCRLLPKGTAFQSDVGMTGPFDSAIGCDVGPIIERALKGIMTPFKVAEDEGQFCATLLRFDDASNVTGIESITINPQRPFKM